MHWTDDTADFAAPRDATTLSPSEDWAHAVPPPAPPPAGWSAWCPVLVRLRPDKGATPFRAAARVIAAHMAAQKAGERPLTLALDPFALAQLARLDTAGARDAHLNAVVMHRTAETAYAPTLTDGIASVFDVLHVGPALDAPVTMGSGPGDPDDVAPDDRPRAPAALIAILDDSFAFAHVRFRDTPRTTRVQRFWAMDDPRRDGATVNLGPCFSKAGIDARLAAAGGDDAALYAAPVLRPLAFGASHGTHVADLAAGADPGTDAPPIIAVALPRHATADTSGGRLETSVIQALHRVLHWADTLYATPTPLVVNFSYGVHAGPKDGSGIIETELRRIAEGRSAAGTPTSIVLPAGNSFRARGRSVVDLAPGEAHTLDWRLLPDDRTVSFAELWLDGPVQAELRVAAPDGPPLCLHLNDCAQVHTLHGAAGPIARVYVQLRGVRLRVTLATAPSHMPDHPRRAAPAGAWRITLTNGAAAKAPLCAAIDVQRDDTPTGFPTSGRQSYLDGPDIDAPDPDTGRRDMADLGGRSNTRSGTLSSYATATSDAVFVVGGAMAATGAPALYGGAGATPGKKTPDLSACCDTSRTHRGLIAAGPLSGATAAFAGTSGAAPLVTRALAAGLVGLPRRQALAALIDTPFDTPDPQRGAGIHRATTAPQPLRRLP